MAANPMPVKIGSSARHHVERRGFVLVDRILGGLDLLRELGTRHSELAGEGPDALLWWLEHSEFVLEQPDDGENRAAGVDVVPVSDDGLTFDLFVLRTGPVRRSEVADLHRVFAVDPETQMARREQRVGERKIALVRTPDRDVGDIGNFGDMAAVRTGDDDDMKPGSGPWWQDRGSPGGDVGTVLDFDLADEVARTDDRAVHPRSDER